MADLFHPALLLSICLTIANSAFADASDRRYAYDARMAFIKAGQLTLDLSRSGDSYEVAGQFQTSRAMSAYYTWNGVFAAVGKWEPGGPVTTAYMARTSSKDDDFKIVLTYPDTARVLEGADGEFESIEKPGGIDLISALFFNPACYQGAEVHDGEDTYQLSLNREKQHIFVGGEGYYAGPVLSCDYGVRDHKDRKRRVIVSLAEVLGTVVAVQVRASIPILPDAVFTLRMPAEALASSGMPTDTARE